MTVNRGTVLLSLGILAALLFIGRTLLLNQFNSLKQEVNRGMKEELKEGIRKEVINIEKDTVAKLKNDIKGIGKKTFAKLKNDLGDIGKESVAKFKSDIEDIEKEAVAKLNNGENLQEQVETWAKSIRGRKVTLLMTMSMPQ